MSLLLSKAPVWSKNYEKLHPDEKNTVRSILFSMDKFGVGDEFIQEFLMTVDDFPVKSYLIKQCRSNLNRQVKISSTPGLAPGPQYFASPSATKLQS